MPTTITGSPNISVLDSRIISDLCTGIFYIDVSPSVFIGAGADNVIGVSVKVVNPYNVAIKNYPTSGYDIYPPLTDDVEVSIPTQASNYQYGTYLITVQLTDSDGRIWYATKSVKISQPDAKNKTKKVGCLSADLNGVCKDGKVYVTVDTVPVYQSAISDSQVNEFTLEYPTSSQQEELDTIQGTFSVQLFEGVYKLTGTICAHYSFGDNLFANVLYEVKCEKNIRCTLDETCILARLVELNSIVKSNCSAAEKKQTQDTIIDALRWIKTIEIAASSGYDASSYIDELEKTLGCSCTCNCNDGVPIINNSPSRDVLISGCNVIKTPTGLTDVYLIDNFEYLIEVADNGSALVITTPVLADCTKKQVITFNIGTVYAQIKGQISNTTEYNYWASITNKSWDALDLTCLGLPLQWNVWTFAQRSQWLFNRFCSSGICEALIEENTTAASANDVVIDWINTSGVYEVSVYMDNILVGTVLNPTSTFTIEGAADGNEHEYLLVSKCTNGAQGAVIRGEFTYFGCPVIAEPTVSSDVVNEDCPFDLTSLVGALPSPIIAEWHNAYNTNESSLVLTPTMVGLSGVYYVYGLEPESGCYSATAARVALNCTGGTSCSAPQNLIVEAITGDYRVRFQSAAFPPPMNSYTVKRRLTSDPDVSGSYTTIGTPTFNVGAGRWEILDTTGVDNTLYTYRAVSNCADGDQTIDYIFANLICPTVTLTPGDTTMGYSFTNSGGGIDKYEVRIYDVTGVTLIHTDTQLPVFATPITGTFIYLDEGATYLVSLKIFIGTYSSVCPYVIGTTNEPDTISPPTSMSLGNPSISGTIEVTTIGGRTLRLSNFSICGVSSASLTISGGVGTINNDIISGVPNSSQNVDTLIPVGSYTYSATLTASCTSTASIAFI